jgi:hypothetical protein
LLKSVGIGPALIVNTLVVLIGATCLWLATGAKTTFFSPSASWTLYLGGVFGFIIIAAAVRACHGARVKFSRHPRESIHHSGDGRTFLPSGLRRAVRRHND